MKGLRRTLQEVAARAPAAAARCLLLAALSAGCGDGSSSSGPDYVPPVVRVDADGQGIAEVGLKGDLLVESAVFSQGVRFALADSNGRALRRARLEYRETADSLVVAHCIDLAGAHRRAVYLGNPAYSAARGDTDAGDTASPLEVRLTLSGSADLDPYYAGPGYLQVVDVDLVWEPPALERLSLAGAPTCQRLAEAVPRLVQGGDAAAWAAVTVGLARLANSEAATGTASGGTVAALTFEEAARFSAEVLLDRTIRFLNLERDETLDPVDGNTVFAVHEPVGLGQLLPEFAGRHLDLEFADAPVCGDTVEEMTAPLPNGAAMTFVWIGPGTFTMGSPPSAVDTGPASDEEPERPVTISTGYWLGKYEVTQEQWERVMGRQPWAAQSHVEPGLSHPASYISWDDLQELLERLNSAAGERLYRLPTEAEWEYACRAGTDTQWSFGDDGEELEEYGWFFDNAWDEGLEWAQAVGGKRPNPWGLHDMHGNLHEWCQDWYGPYVPGPQIDPPGPLAGATRVVRGGVFFRAAHYTRSADRADRAPGHQYYDVGARLVRVR